MLSGWIDRGLVPGNSYSEEEIASCVMESTGADSREAALVRIGMLMRGELVLEPGATDDDARFRRVKRLV